MVIGLLCFSTFPSIICPVKADITFSDEFNSSSLDPRWRFVDPAKGSSYDLTSKPGFLAISTVNPPDRDIYTVKNNDGPRMVQSATGNFDVETKVFAITNIFVRSAGILIWKDEKNFLRIERASRPYQEVMFVGMIAGVWSMKAPEITNPGAIVHLSSNIDTTCLRISRVGNKFSGYYSLDGKSWIHVADINLVVTDPIDIGPYIVNCYDSGSFIAYFDYFRMVSYESSSTMLVGYWKFDEGAGIIAHDFSVNGNDGKVYGATWIDGKVGKALSFDGSNDYVRVENSPSLQLSESITVTSWVKIEGSTGDHQIICTEWYGPSGEYAKNILSFILEFLPDGKTPQFKLNNIYGTENWAISSKTITFGEWTYVAGTFDGSTIRIYVNGLLTGSAKLSGPINVGKQPLIIGAHTRSDDRNWLKGTIDEVKVYNYARTAEEIKGEYQSFPDLVISDISWKPSNPSAGDSVIFSYVIENQGNKDTTDFTTVLYIDGKRIDVSARGSLLAGSSQSRSFTYAWVSLEGSHIVEVIADDLNEIAESNEANNKMSRNLVITKKPTLINAQIIEYSILKGKFKAGDKITVTVTIKNTGDVKWTFYMDFFVKDSTKVGKTWHAPYKTITLESGASGNVMLEWLVDMSAPAGAYNGGIVVWKSDTDGQKDMLDVKEITQAFEIIPDGYDYDALEWINIIEARKLTPEDEDMSDVTIAIIDMGIDPDVWEYINGKGGNIILYVRPEQYWDWWSFSWKWRYLITDNLHNSVVKDLNLFGGHGSKVTSVVWQVAPKVNIIIFSVNLELLSPATTFERVEKVLQWIINNINEYNIDIVTMSLASTYDEVKILEDEIKTLYDKHKIVFIASSGNKNVKTDLYPASFKEVISIGGIFDDSDEFLTYALSKKFNLDYCGHRVVESIYLEYSESPYEVRMSPKDRPVGSTYSDNIDFVAPMFDIEVLSWEEEGDQSGISDVYATWVDGTSFSTPMTAGVISLLIHEYKKVFGSKPNPSTIYEALRETSESSSDIIDFTPKPVVDGKVSDKVFWSDRVGWGCIDAYDAILYIRKKR